MMLTFLHSIMLPTMHTFKVAFLMVFGFPLLSLRPSAYGPTSIGGGGGLLICMLSIVDRDRLVVSMTWSFVENGSHCPFLVLGYYTPNSPLVWG